MTKMRSGWWLAALVGLGACAGAASHERVDELPSTAAGPSPGAPKASGARPLELRPRPEAAPTTAAAAPMPDGAVSRAEIELLLQRGPGWLMSQVALEPVIAAGRRFLGFRLVSMFDDGVRVRRSGVRAGDIVQRVNGVPLRTPDDLTKILAGLRQASAIDLKMLRDGEPVTVRLAIVDPAHAQAKDAAN